MRLSAPYEADSDAAGDTPSAPVPAVRVKDGANPLATAYPCNKRKAVPRATGCVHSTNEDILQAPEQNFSDQDPNLLLLEEDFVVPEENFLLLEQMYLLLEGNFFLLEQNFVLPEQMHLLPEQNFLLLEGNFFLPEENFSLPEQNHFLLEQNHFLLEQNSLIPEQNFSEQDQNFLSEEQKISRAPAEIFQNPDEIIETLAASRRLRHCLNIARAATPPCTAEQRRCSRHWGVTAENDCVYDFDVTNW